MLGLLKSLMFLYGGIILIAAILCGIAYVREKKFEKRFTPTGDFYVDEFGLFNLEEEKYYH